MTSVGPSCCGDSKAEESGDNARWHKCWVRPTGCPSAVPGVTVTSGQARHCLKGGSYFFKNSPSLFYPVLLPVLSSLLSSSLSPFLSSASSSLSLGFPLESADTYWLKWPHSPHHFWHIGMRNWGGEVHWHGCVGITALHSFAWKRHSYALKLSFLICKMVTLTVPNQWSCGDR